MWLTPEDDKRVADALNGHNPDRHETEGYIKGEYCPHCGAQKVKVDLVHCYIFNNRSTGSVKQLVCENCCYGYGDTLEGRWRLRVGWGGNSVLLSVEPIPELCNPHEWRKQRGRVKEMVRSANRKR